MANARQFMAARTAAWAKTSNDEMWEDILTFDTNFIDNTLFPTVNRIGATCGFKFSGSSRFENGIIIPNVSDYVYLSPNENILPAVGWRMLIDCHINANEDVSKPRCIFDSSVGFVNTRGFYVGIGSDGRWYRNSKMNGNGSISKFLPTTSEPFFDASSSYDGIFEHGVEPSENGWRTYFKFNGGCEYYGATFGADSFSGELPNFKTMIGFNNYNINYGYITGLIRSIRFQVSRLPETV